MARKARFSFTFDLFTPESIEAGVREDGGWAMPGGWLYALPFAPGNERNTRLAEARRGDFDLSLRDALRSAMGRACERGEFTTDLGGGFHCYASDQAYPNEYSADRIRYCLHGDNLSAGSVARIRRLLGCR